jgi:serine/threonine protein kinase
LDVVENEPLTRGAGIVHGDLKPHNILVFNFDDSGGRVTPKVSDFGYSTLLAKDDINAAIRLPGTPGWCAPEWHHRYTTTDVVAAKKIDVYSFGLLCAWLLFPTSLAGTQQHTDEYPSPEEVLSSALAGLEAAGEISDATQLQLHKMFDSTLAREPGERCSDFEPILKQLSANK